MPHGISPVIMENSILEYTPVTIDPIEFITGTYEDKRKEEKILLVNRKVNLDFLKNYKRPVALKNKTKKVNVTIIDSVLDMKVLIGNNITIAMSSLEENQTSYNLYHLYKLTNESKPNISQVGRVTNNPFKLEMEVSKEKLNFQGKLLKTGSAVGLIYLFYFL